MEERPVAGFAAKKWMARIFPVHGDGIRACQQIIVHPDHLVPNFGAGYTQAGNLTLRKG